MTGKPLLDVSGLAVSVPSNGQRALVVREVGFTLGAGESLGVVGESGSGKTLTARALVGIGAPGVRREEGSIRFKGRELTSLSERELRAVRGGEIGTIPQDPSASLNPTMRLGDQIAEAIAAHRRRRPTSSEVSALLQRVGMPDPERRRHEYPHRLSGGMRQRGMIAIAIANAPDLLIADEPTTALDVTLQAQILRLLRDLGRQSGMALLLITHNMGLVADMCDRLLVMYAGRVVESGPAETVFEDPRHPYTAGLLQSVPRLDTPTGRRLPMIEGQPPLAGWAISGCPFHPRCPLAREICTREMPPLSADGEHTYACWAALDGERPGLAAGAGDGGDGGRPRGREPEPPSSRLLEMEGLSKSFDLTRANLFATGRHQVQAVAEVDLTVDRGETLGIVGESGCGKTTLGRMLVKLVEPTAGRIRFDGIDVRGARGDALRRLRGGVQMIFQDPSASLNPRMTIGDLVGEPFVIHGSPRQGDVRARVGELLRSVGLDPALATRYPREISGGQRQRVSIARALAIEPRLLVADEPTSSLDVSVQSQVINLLEDLRDGTGLAMVFIAHDLALIRHISDRVAVMYLGRIVELGTRDQVCERPLHPYTTSLLAAVPIPDPALQRRRTREMKLVDDVPTSVDPPGGCPFHPRCPIGPRFHPERTICLEQRPPLVPQHGAQMAACHFAGEMTPVTAVAAR